MHLANLDLNLLVLFRALMTHRSATRAAEDLRLSPSAVSHALGRLRAGYNDPLFVRAGARMEPTARALEIAGAVDDALQKIELTFSQGFSPGLLKREFRVGLVSFAAVYLVPAILGRLATEAPGVRLTIDYMSEDEVAEAIASRKLDFALGIVEAPHPDWRTTPLFVDRLQAVAANGHPTIGRTLSKAQFLRARHVRIPLLATVDTALAAAGLRRTFAASSDGILPALFAVARSDLLAIVPGTIVKIYGHVCHVKPLKLPVTLPPHVISLMHHPQCDGDRAHAWLMSSIRDLAQELAAAVGTAVPAAMREQARRAGMREPAASPH